MKKLLLCVAAVAILLSAATLASCGKKSESAKIRLNEVVHSIFYAPQYVALEKGFFAEEGLEVVLDVGQGADKSMTALVSGNADIALLGTEAGIYVYAEGRDDYAIAFAQLTQRAGNFLISRTDDRDFKWADVKGKTIIGGRAGGMPQMLLEYILRQNGMDPHSDVEILTNLQFTTTAGAFTGGVGDYTAEFDPSALALETAGAGYVVASMGVDSGYVPYTVYMATKDYIKNNGPTVQKFTNAIYKAQLWVAAHSAVEIAAAIAPHFPDNTAEELALMIERYNSQDTWKSNPVFEENSFMLIQDIMEQSGELSVRVPYSDMINTDFAKTAVEKVKH